MTNCNVEKLVEFARIGSPPDRALRTHLQNCDSCHSRFEAEKVLTAAMAAVRVSSSDLRSSAVSRATLLNRFDDLHAAPPNHRWLWTFAAAAMLILSFGVVRQLPAPVHTRAPQLAAASAEDPAWLAAADSQEDGFIAVPYVPPLAAGELVRVVHTELDPAALSSLGINVDPAWTTRIPADLLVAEDDSPRAIRLTNNFERTI